jgi:hypothetical protein
VRDTTTENQMANSQNERSAHVERDRSTRPTQQRPERLQLEYPHPVTTETLWLIAKSPYGPRGIEVQSSSDGQTFTSHKKQRLKRDGEQVISIPRPQPSLPRRLWT